MKTSYTVMKFGGTSVDDVEQVHRLIQTEAKSSSPIAVVSAFSGQTDELLKTADFLLNSPYRADSVKGLAATLKNTITHPWNKGRLAISKHFILTNLDQASDHLMASHIDKLMENEAERVAAEIWPIWNNSKLKSETIRTFVTDRIIGLGEVYSAQMTEFLHKLFNPEAKQLQTVNLSNLLSVNPEIIQEQQQSEIPLDQLFQKLIGLIRGKICEALGNNKIPIISGYLGYIPGGILQTIDRGYSDSTAALTAVAAKGIPSTAKRAPEEEEETGFVSNQVKLQILKEVPGLLSADPRLVEPGYSGKTHRHAEHFKVARLRPQASLLQAAELADLGGMKAINPKGIYILDGQNIQLQVKSTINPEHPGTIIADDEAFEADGISFISGKKGQSVITVQSSKMINQKGVAGNIFQQCSELGISVDAINTSATKVLFSIESDHLQKANLLAKLATHGKITIKENLAIVCLVGNGMQTSVGLITKAAGSLSSRGINLIFPGGDDQHNITLVIGEEDYEKAIKGLHQDFIEDMEPNPAQLEIKY